MSGPHPSHDTRVSDASTFDEICVNCGATDQVPGGWGRLAFPCTNPPTTVVEDLAEVPKDGCPDCGGVGRPGGQQLVPLRSGPTDDAEIVGEDYCEHECHDGPKEVLDE